MPPRTPSPRREPASSEEMTNRPNWKALMITALQATEMALDGLPIPAAKTCISLVLKVLEAADTVNNNTELLKQLNARYSELIDFLSPVRRNDIPQDLKDILRGLDLKLSKLARRWEGRLTKKPRKSNFIISFIINLLNLLTSSRHHNELEQFVREMDQAVQDFLLRLQVNTWLSMHAQTLTNRRLAALSAMDRAHDAAFNNDSRPDRSRACLEDTRKTVLSSINDWATEDGHPPIFWLSGLAGIGKTTIAHTVASQLDARNRLGGSFFFLRSNDRLSKASLVFPTLAWQLSSVDPLMKARIADVLENDPACVNQDVATQFDRLILKPLSTIPPPKPLVLVLDALDECQPDELTMVILRVLITNIEKIPFLRVFITSRPEAHIREALDIVDGAANPQKLVLHENVEAQLEVEKDIRLYLTTSLQKIWEKDKSRSGRWPSEKQMSALVKQSGKLFIYAKTIVLFMDESYSSKVLNQRLESLIGPGEGGATNSSATPYKHLDDLYLRIFDMGLLGVDMTQPYYCDRFHHIIGSVALMKKAVPMVSLANFIGQYDVGELRDTLRKLHSVLIVPDDASKEIHSYHLSFSNFITNPMRCTNHHAYINPSLQESFIFFRCITTIARSFGLVPPFDGHATNQHGTGNSSDVGRPQPPRVLGSHNSEHTGGDDNDGGNDKDGGDDKHGSNDKDGGDDLHEEVPDSINTDHLSEESGNDNVGDITKKGLDRDDGNDFYDGDQSMSSENRYASNHWCSHLVNISVAAVSTQEVESKGHAQLTLPLESLEQLAGVLVWFMGSCFKLWLQKRILRILPTTGGVRLKLAQDTLDIIHHARRWIMSSLNHQQRRGIGKILKLEARKAFVKLFPENVGIYTLGAHLGPPNQDDPSEPIDEPSVNLHDREERPQEVEDANRHGGGSSTLPVGDHSSLLDDDSVSLSTGSHMHSENASFEARNVESDSLSAQEIDESFQRVVLSSIPRAHYAAYNAIRTDRAKSCLQGTRKRLLATINNWAEHPDPRIPPILCLTGPAGVGKTTVAHTVAISLDKRAQLGGSFFFLRSDDQLKDARLVLPTLAWQLSKIDPQVQARLIEVLERNPSCVNQDIATQFHLLIQAPLSGMSRQEPVVIVLDALDECRPKAITADIFRVLIDNVRKIPFLRILITSRPEAHIRALLADVIEGYGHQQLVRHIDMGVQEEVKDDIRLYLKINLQRIWSSDPVHLGPWPYEEQLERLVQQSGNLFIYAATVVSLIGGFPELNINRKLYVLLNITNQDVSPGDNPYHRLDQLHLAMQLLRDSA